MQNRIPIWKILYTGFALLVINSCGTVSGGNSTTGNNGSADASKPGILQSTLILSKVGALGKVGGLAKANATSSSEAINLSKLILTGISGTTPPDTVRDTSTVSGNAQVTVTRTLTLKPLRNWTLFAKTLDAKDSLIHSGSTAAFYVKPADTVQVALNLASRFAMYEARFNSLPDSISSTTSGTGKDILKIKRVVLKVDGVIRADSSASVYYSSGQTIVIFFDYISTGAHTVLLEAYGDVNTYSGLLYDGSSSINVAAATDDNKSVTLTWRGPTTGTGKLTVTLGKVGKVTINGALPGTIIP